MTPSTTDYPIVTSDTKDLNFPNDTNGPADPNIPVFLETPQSTVTPVYTCPQ